MVLIVDDQAPFRRLISALLTSAGLGVAGEAAEGEQALIVAQALRPDVVLLDVQLPGIDGFEVARRLAGSPDSPRVVMISSRDASDYGARLTDAPVLGFIPKQDLSAETLNALLAPAR